MIYQLKGKKDDRCALDQDFFLFFNFSFFFIVKSTKRSPLKIILNIVALVIISYFKKIIMAYVPEV